MAENYYSIGPTAASIVQGGGQYSIGVTTGYLIDQLFSMLGKNLDKEGNPFKQFLLMIGQAGVNGVALRFVLPYLHGDSPSTGYRDPTGGYLLAIGMLHGQPTFGSRAKGLIGGLIEAIEDMAKRDINAVNAAVSDMVGDARG